MTRSQGNLVLVARTFAGSVTPQRWIAMPPNARGSPPISPVDEFDFVRQAPTMRVQEDQDIKEDEERRRQLEASRIVHLHEKGFQNRKRYGDEEVDMYRYREMVWERVGGRWCGRWQWTEWEEQEVCTRRIEDHRERAIRAWDAANVPQETLLWIVECLVGSPLTAACAIEDAARGLSFRAKVDIIETGLSTLALVCRAWYTLIAPMLYSKIEVRDETFESGIPRRSVLQHGRRITVRGVRPFMTSARVSQLAPAPLPVAWMRLVGQNRRRGKDGEAGEGAASSCASIPYHPSHAAIYAQLHRSWTGIATLDLYGCHFLSSSDLLRLLASFSALERVYLNSVDVAHVATSVVRPPGPGKLRHISVHANCTPPGLSFLTHHWTWARNYHGSPFHGLLPEEQRSVARICEQFAVIGARGTKEARVARPTYILDAMDTQGRTWVVWLRTGLRSAHVEFHANQGGSECSGAARVQHILLRVRHPTTLRELAQSSSELVDALAHFTHLKTIVLETGSQPVLTKFMHAEIQSLIEALRKAGRAEVRHRMCEEAHMLAHQMKNGAASSPKTGLLSPFWCLEEYASTWHKFLSGEYTQDFPENNWRGWDPSRPFARPQLPLTADDEPASKFRVESTIGAPWTLSVRVDLGYQP